MLNAFPSLLAYGLAGAFIIRIVLGILFVLAGFIKVFRNREECARIFREAGLPAPRAFSMATGLIEIAGGIFLIAGFGTQIAAIVLAIVTLGFLTIKIRQPELLHNDVTYYILILAMALSLAVTGAGFFAFDLPL